MAWYRTGTVTVTNGSATVAGSGTAFIANVSIGEGFLGPDGRVYEITNVASDTSLTISPNYQGSTAGGQGYAVAPLRGRIADLIAETGSLLASFATVRDGIGAGLYPDGSAGAPAFRFSGDQDTGFFRAGNNTIGVATSGAARAFFNDNGSLWLRPTTSAAESLILSLGAAASGAVSAFDILTSDISSVALMRIRQSRYTGSIIMTHQSDTGEKTGLTITNNPGSHVIDLFGPEADNTVKTRISGTEASYFTNSLAVGANSPGSYRLNVNKGTQGNIAQFTDAVESTFVIRTESGVLQCGQANNLPLALLTNSIERLRIAANGQILAGSDNSQALGGAANRWSVVYAGTGTINTSDEREKHWRGELTAAELRAAKQIIAELGIYQWNDAVEEKGEDDARLHFGIRAQRAFAIMEDEGLDWGRYAWACYDQWEEQTEAVIGEDGEPTGETRVTLEAGDRYGVRPDQLAFWLIAAQAAMQAELEARIAALEAA